MLASERIISSLASPQLHSCLRLQNAGVIVKTPHPGLFSSRGTFSFPCQYFLCLAFSLYSLYIFLHDFALQAIFSFPTGIKTGPHTSISSFPSLHYPPAPSRRGFSNPIIIYLSFYKMPKAASRPTNTSHRTTPYPITTTASLAPSTMAPRGTSPPASGSDRHASQSWPPENDQLLMDARQRGMNWQPIATSHFPDKTANACRKRHERLMEKRNANENWEGVKMETLARAYVDVREQMWKILADRVGEKWQTVEQKVRFHPKTHF